MENKNKPAYPTEYLKGINYESGLSKREIFAMAAMQGLCANSAFRAELTEDSRKGSKSKPPKGQNVKWNKERSSATYTRTQN